MNRNILTTVREDYYLIEIYDSMHNVMRIFGYYDNVIYAIGYDEFVRSLAASLYNSRDVVSSFSYFKKGGNSALLELRIKEGHNFFELDFTEFNKQMYGVGSKDFIFE